MRFDQVLAHLAGAHWLWLGAAVGLATLTFPLRAVRWRFLLRLEGAPLPPPPLWHATAIGFMANNVLLSGRAGEVIRPLVLHRLTGVRFTAAFASIAVERILDGITLVVLLLIATAAGGFDATTRIGGVTLGSIATGGAALFGGLLLVALLVVRWPHAMLGVAERVARALLPSRWAARLHGWMAGLIDGLDVLAAPRRAAAALAWSAVIWLVAAASFWLAFRAFHLNVPWSAAFMLQALLAFGVALPAAPGFAGVFEAVTKAALLLYGVGEDRAISLAIGYHVATWIPITLLGFWSLARVGLRLRDIRAPGDGSREP